MRHQMTAICLLLFLAASPCLGWARRRQDHAHSPDQASTVTTNMRFVFAYQEGAYYSHTRAMRQTMERQSIYLTRAKLGQTLTGTLLR